MEAAAPHITLVISLDEQVRQTGNVKKFEGFVINSTLNQFLLKDVNHVCNVWMCIQSENETRFAERCLARI